MADASITTLEAPTNSDWPGTKINPSPPATSGEVVTICLKRAAGIFLERYESRDVREVGPSGAKAVKQYFPVPESKFEIRGFGKLYHLAAETRGMIQPQFPGNFALTPGVPRDLWLHWLHFHQHDALVTSGMIFAVENPADAPLECRARESLVTGEEPLDPSTPSQVTGKAPDFRNPVGSVSKVEPSPRN